MNAVPKKEFIDPEKQKKPKASVRAVPKEVQDLITVSRRSFIWNRIFLILGGAIALTAVGVASHERQKQRQLDAQYAQLEARTAQLSEEGDATAGAVMNLLELPFGQIEELLQVAQLSEEERAEIKVLANRIEPLVLEDSELDMSMLVAVTTELGELVVNDRKKFASALEFTKLEFERRSKGEQERYVRLMKLLGGQDFDRIPRRLKKLSEKLLFTQRLFIDLDDRNHSLRPNEVHANLLYNALRAYMQKESSSIVQDLLSDKAVHNIHGLEFTYPGSPSDFKVDISITFDGRELQVHSAAQYKASNDQWRMTDHTYTSKFSLRKGR